MLNPQILDIIEWIKQLPSAYDEDDLNPHLSKAIYALEQYDEQTQQQKDKVRLAQLNQRIETFLDTHKDAGITHVKEEDGPFKESHTFNGTYGFYLSDASQLDALDTYLDFILVELIDQIDAKPAPVTVSNADINKNGWHSHGPTTSVMTWNTVSEPNWSTPVECTPSTEEVEHDSGDFQPTTEATEMDDSSSELPEEPILNPEETALQKKKNVEHLNEIRNGIDRIAEERRQKELKIRTDGIATVIANNHNTVARLSKVVTDFLTEYGEPTVNLSEVIDEVLNHNFVNDPAIIRTVIKVIEINLKSTLTPIPSVVIGSDTTNGLLPYSSKAHLAYITICNLATVRAHETVREYSVFELITYMLDYCETTSSLNIADTPEEIVELMSGVYDIFVSNALNPEFVYNSAVAQSTIIADTWHRVNPVVTHYLDKIPEVSAADSKLKPVTALYAARNLLMSQQYLERTAVVELRDILDAIWIVEQSDVLYEYHPSAECYVIIARNIGPYENVCIVIDKAGAMSYAAKDNSMSYQKNYDVHQTAELLRWFNILL